MQQSLIPPLPPYEGLHPVVVHFPIALLLIVPVFVILAAVWKSQAKGMLAAALVLAVLGSGFAFLATSTGEATEGFAKAIPGTRETLHRHEELAEKARNIFAFVTLLLGAATVLYWKKEARISTGMRIAGAAVLLAMLAVPSVLLISAAHEGGRLVHIYGVRAPITLEARPPANGN